MHHTFRACEGILDFDEVVPEFGVGLCSIPPPSAWTNEQAIRILAQFAWSWTSTVDEILDGRKFSSKDWNSSVVKCYGHRTSLVMLLGIWWCRDHEFNTLDEILTQGALANTELSRLDPSGCTPLFVMSWVARWHGGHDGSLQHLRRWVAAVARGNVDLCAYGDIEHKHWPKRRELNGDWRRNGSGMIGLAYGPRPADWWIWYDHPGDLFAGTFWDMLEHPERAIPGVWEDTSDIDDALPRYEDDTIRCIDRRAGVKSRTIRRIRRALNLLPPTCAAEYVSPVDRIS